MYDREGECTPFTPLTTPLAAPMAPVWGGSGLRKSQMRMVSSCELLTIWNSSNWSRNTRPVCSTKVRRQSVPLGDRGSSAAVKSQTFILLESH